MPELAYLDSRLTTTPSTRRADVGQGQADQSTEDGGGEGIDDHQHQLVHVEALGRADEDADQGGEHGGEDPGGPPDVVTVDTDHVGQIRIVHRGSGGGAEPGVAQQRPQHRGHRQRDQQGAELVVAHVEMGSQREGRGREDGLEGPVLFAVDDRHQRGEGGEHPDAHHDEDLGRQSGQGPVEGFEEDAEHRSHHQKQDGHRHPGCQAPGVVQLPIGEGAEHGDGPVGEVEDPDRLVGQDHTHGRQPVDAPGEQTDDEEGPVLAHEEACTACPPQ